MNRLKIEISDVYPNEGQVEGLPANPRLIKKEKVEQLKKSIQDLPEMTEARDLLVYPHNGKYIVIGGNMRLRAYRELGWKEVPCCILPENMPVDKLREIVIQDNNPFGETDWNMIANEWDVEELKDWGMDLPADWDTSGIDDTKCEAEEDEFSDEDAEKAEPRVKLGEIWKLGEHRLMCGDSTDAAAVALLMDGQKADLYITDPPYNVDYTGGTKDSLKILNDKMDDSSFLHFLIDSFQSANQSLKAGAAFYVWHADSEGYNFRKAVRETGWMTKQCLIWNKNSFVLGRQDYQWKHEPCLYGWKNGGKHYFINNRTLSTVYEDNPIEYNKMKKSELLEIVKKILEPKVETTVFNENKPTRNGDHPTMKPVRLIGRCIKNSSKEGWVVLDSFGGSGSTLIACEQLSRKCYMMELDPHYCDVIIARWEKLTGKEAVKVHG